MKIALRVEASFVDRLRELSPDRQAHILNRLTWFQTIPHDKALRLRPLRCREGYFLISSIRGDRIILRKESEELYAAVDCGGHEIIDEWENLAS